MAVPTLTTPTVSSITENSAVLGATLVATGGPVVTQRGTVWDVAPNPIINTARTGSDGIATDGVAGYIDLDTTLLASLLAAGKDLMVVMVCRPTFVNNAILWSAEGGDSANWPRLFMHGTIADNYAIVWSTSGGAGDEVSIQTGIIGDNAPHVFVFTINQQLGQAYLAVDEETAFTDTEVSSLDNPDSNQIRIGASLDTAGNYSTITAAFFAVMSVDAEDIGEPANAAFTEAIATAVRSTHASKGWRAEDIRAAILAVNNNLSGEFWKLNEAGSTGAFDSQDVIKYSVADGSILDATGGLSSAAGCDGIEFVNRKSLTAYTMVRENITEDRVIYFRGFATNSEGTGYSEGGAFRLSSGGYKSRGFAKRFTNPNRFGIQAGRFSVPRRF